MTDVLIAGIIVLLRSFMYRFMYEQHLALNNNCRLLHYLLHLLSIVPIHSRVSQKYNDAFTQNEAMSVCESVHYAHSIVRVLCNDWKAPSANLGNYQSLLFTVYELDLIVLFWVEAAD